MKRRLERLELATRYRPIHMECLVLHPAPPERLEDYFYMPEGNGAKRNAQARKFFNALMAAAEVDIAHGEDDSALLAEFQRKGWFLAACCECPLEESGVAPLAVAAKFAETLVKRVRLSYKPKRIALASQSLELLRKALEAAGFAEIIAIPGVNCD